MKSVWANVVIINNPIIQYVFPKEHYFTEQKWADVKYIEDDKLGTTGNWEKPPDETVYTANANFQRLPLTVVP